MCNHSYKLESYLLETYWKCQKCGNKIYLKEPR